MKITSFPFLKGSNYEIVLPIRFLVLFGVEVMGFQRVSGLGRAEDVEWFNEGGVNDHPMMLRGPQKNPYQLRFSRGMKMNSIGLNTLLSLAGGRLDHYGGMGMSTNIGTVLVLGREGTVKALYGFVSHGVLEWEVEDLDAQGASPLIETFTVAHDGLINLPIPSFL